MKGFFIFLVVSISFFQQSNLSYASEAQASVYPPVPIESNGEVAFLSDQEKEWYREFQEGNLFSDGWQEISSEILAKTPENNREQQREILHNLGHRIGMEWCKDNTIRRIDTSLLKKWGSLLKDTAREKPEQLNQVVASIKKEVDTLLQ